VGCGGRKRGSLHKHSGCSHDLCSLMRRPLTRGPTTHHDRRPAHRSVGPGLHTAVDDTAVDDTAVDDTAVDDTAVDDTAVDDTAVDDTAVDDRPEACTRFCCEAALGKGEHHTEASRTTTGKFR